MAIVWRVDERRIRLRLIGSLLLNICLSLGRYFSDKQKEGLPNSPAPQEFRIAGQIHHGALEGPDQFVLNLSCPPPCLGLGSLGGLL